MPGPGRVQCPQVATWYVPLAGQGEDLSPQQFAVAAGGLVGRQDAFVHPALDGAHADAEGFGGLHRAQVGGRVGRCHEVRSHNPARQTPRQDWDIYWSLWTTTSSSLPELLENVP